MPISAIFNGSEVFSFQYSAKQWEVLKKEYRNSDLRLRCCGRRGVPTESHLHRFPYFKHYIPTNDYGEDLWNYHSCEMHPECEETLYLTYAFAVAAMNAGWEVRTEESVSSNNDHGLLDVLCSRGEAWIGIGVCRYEVTPKQIQTFDNLMSHYKPGVRAFLFYRIPAYTASLRLPTSIKMPTFAYCVHDDNFIYVPDLSVEVEFFAKALFEGRVHPRREPKGIFDSYWAIK